MSLHTLNLSCCVSVLPNMSSFLDSVLYIDGGTGSMLFQAALGGLLTLTYFFSMKMTAVKEVFARILGRGSNASSE
jgi:hypothetical protein